MNKLLKILDMSEDEQTEWVEDNCKLFGWQSKGSGFVPTESLADLAFRLRDEVIKTNLSEQYADALWLIKRKQKWNIFARFLCEAKPIDFIIAALIAKGRQ